MNEILMVSDIDNWAFQITADGLRPYFDFDVLYTSQEPKISVEKIKKYRRTHFFNWLGGQSFAHMKGVSGGVCQHNFELKWLKEAKAHIPKFSKMVAISKELYSPISRMNPNTHYIPNGVDEKLFTPTVNEGEFAVGWCGQRTSGGFGEKKGNEGRPVFDIKGYELILKPLIERLSGKVKFKINDRNHENALSREEMAEWYKDIDCFICTSIYEGGPLPVLEAAASGKTIIGTRVGIVPELVDHATSGIVIEKPQNRSECNSVIDKFEKYINYMQDCRDWCAAMGKNVREEIEKKWTWEKIAPLWKEFFDE